MASAAVSEAASQPRRTSARGYLFGLLPRLLALACGAWLLTSAWPKLLEPVEFASIVAKHGVVSPGLVESLSGLLVAAELALALLLLLSSLAGIRVTCITLWAAAAFFLFLGLYALAILLDPPAKPVPCGSGGSTKPVENWLPIVVQNGVFAICCGTAAFGSQRLRRRAV